MAGKKDISSEFLTRLGGYIKEKRKERNMTLEELGLEIGLSRMQVHRIEKGYNITMLTLLKISMALEISTDEMLKIDQSYKKEDLEKLVNKSKSNNNTKHLPPRQKTGSSKISKQKK